MLTSNHYTSRLVCGRGLYFRPRLFYSFSDDTAVIAISTGGLSTGFNETPKLDPPPGLTHPSQHSSNVPTVTSNAPMATSNVPMATSNVPMATGGLLPPPTQSQHESALSMSGGATKLDDLLTASTSNSYTLAMNPVSLVCLLFYSFIHTYLFFVAYFL